MTAEERMAYFQGEKRRNNVYQENKSERNNEKMFLKIRFFIAVILFVVFLSLDYTGYKIQGIGSSEIIHEVITDFDVSRIVWVSQRKKYHAGYSL